MSTDRASPDTTPDGHAAPEADLLSARALCALLHDSREIGGGRYVLGDERAMDALLCTVLRDISAMGMELFHAGSDTNFEHWWNWEISPAGKDQPDICGGPAGAASPTHLIEVKLAAKYNPSKDGRGQLDRYHELAPDAQCFVVMPEWRAISLGEIINGEGTKGKKEMLDWHNQTGELWKIVTWEAILNWLDKYLDTHLGEHPTSIDGNPAYRLAARMARVWRR